MPNYIDPRETGMPDRIKYEAEKASLRAERIQLDALEAAWKKQDFAMGQVFENGLRPAVPNEIPWDGSRRRAGFAGKGPGSGVKAEWLYKHDKIPEVQTGSLQLNEISREMGALTGAIEGLENQYAGLNHRLSRVMREISDVPEGSLTECSPQTSLGNDIRGLRYRVEQLSAKIGGLMERLEL